MLSHIAWQRRFDPVHLSPLMPSYIPQHSREQSSLVYITRFAEKAEGYIVGRKRNLYLQQCLLPNDGQCSM